MGTRPDFVQFVYDMVGEIDARCENRCFNVNVENVAEVEFDDFGSECFHEGANTGLYGHADFNKKGETNGLFNYFLYEHETTGAKDDGCFFQIWRFFLDNKNGEIAHAFKEFVDEEDILEEPVVVDVVHINVGGGE